FVSQHVSGPMDGLPSHSILSSSFCPPLSRTFHPSNSPLLHFSITPPSRNPHFTPASSPRALRSSSAGQLILISFRRRATSLFLYLFRRVGKQYRVARGFAHLRAAVEAGKAGEFRQLCFRLREDVPIGCVKPPGDLASDLDMRHLIFADGDNFSLIQ